MGAIEYLDPSIAGEGESANNWQPGAWTNAPSTTDEEYQPDIEPPHINDYAAFKKHKHYRQYFRPYRYIPFPAWMYHRTQEPRLVKSKEEVMALGPEWSPTPIKPRVDMTGKSLPTKSDTQRLTEALVAGLTDKKPDADPASIAAIVAAVMSAMQPMLQAQQPTAAAAPAEPEDAAEREEMLKLAAEQGVKIDKRWSNDRIKKELGL
jgi:hypothetical protein